MPRLNRVPGANRTLDGISLLSAKSCVVLVATGLLNLSGCDPVRTTRQNITIAVDDVHGLPVPDVKVSIKESWESWQTWGGGIKEGEESYFRQNWESDFVPWYEGRTNAEGKSEIKLVVTALDWTKGSQPPVTRDIVSNREYIVKLQTQDREEGMLVIMSPGTITMGKRFTVRIETIEKPSYVQ